MKKTVDNTKHRESHRYHQSHPYFLTAKLFPFSKEEKQVLLPDEQIQKLGLLYSSYRFLMSMFLFMSSYAVMFQSELGVSKLPSFLQQSVLLFYCLFSLLLLSFFFIAKEHFRRELLVGLIIDVSFIGLLLFVNGAADIQLVVLYIVVVFVSFMLLLSYQAIIITMLAVLSVIYHQSYKVFISTFNLANFGESLLLSLSFLGVGYLSWSISQRLALVEKIAADNANKNEQLNVINQEVISKMEQGVLVLDADYRIILSNDSACTLLSLDIDHYQEQNSNSNAESTKNDQQRNKVDGRSLFSKRRLTKAFKANNHEIKKNVELERLLNQNHDRLIDRISDMPTTIKSEFLYHYINTNEHVVEKMRLTTLPMKDGIILVMMEDLKREQTNAQQLKLASLGQLTASIAHEIRNPLAAISQASELLMEDVKESFLQAQPAHNAQTVVAANNELYTMIFNQTKRVNRIIEDVLKLSRQAKPEQHKLPLFTWLKEFLQNHYANDAVIFVENTFTTNNEVYVFFDPSQLEQVLINLINNGLRFSKKIDAKTPVEIVVICKSNNVMIDVLDSGTGIDSDKVDNLFMPFFTTDNDGTGLGLYLSQAFAEANFARLFFNPNHEKTCFRLLMPNAK